MKIKFDFEGGSATFPSAAVERVKKASPLALRLLIMLASDEDLRENYEKNAEKVCKILSCERGELDMALSFWCGAGIADMVDGAGAEKDGANSNDTAASDGGQSADADAPKKKKKLPRAAGVPDYTSEELGDMLEQDSGALAFVDEAQRRIGRMMNSREVGILMGIKNELRLDPEYIFILLDFCRRIEKTSMRYVETMAYAMFDEDVRDVEALALRLAEREAFASLEGRFKVMIGARGRKLTAKETRFLNRWSVEMKYSFEMIELAYEITVDAQHEYNPAYMNGILERWYAASIMTPEAVRAEAEAHKKKDGASTSGSFDTDEFFEAALRRSYGDGK